MQLSVDSDSYQGPPRSFFPPTYKVVIVGNFGVGKTALLWHFLHKDLAANGKLDVVHKRITIKDKDIELEFWDTVGMNTTIQIMKLHAHVIVGCFVGQERFRTISPSYYVGAHAIIVVYDMTDRESFTEVKQYWMKEIVQIFGQDADHRMPIMLIGTKADLAAAARFDSEQKIVKKRDVIELKKEYDRILGPYECSAQTGKNVDKAFHRIAEDLVRRDTLGTSRNFETNVTSACKIC